MVEKVQYKVNDVVRMKKKHPCGSDTWTILRVVYNFDFYHHAGCSRRIVGVSF